MYVCICNAVNDRQVKQALDEGRHSLRSLREHLGYTSSCGRCTGCLRGMIEHHLNEAGRSAVRADPGLMPEVLCG